MIPIAIGQTNVMLFRKINTWFSVKDGAWSDPNTWVSNGLDKKNTLYPQPGDNVWINNAVVCDVNATVGNLYGNGILSFSGSITLTVNGDIQITGTVDQTATGSNLILNGYNNVVVNYIASTSSVMTYNGVFTQNIMNLSYGSLTTQNVGFKYQTSNLTIAGTFTINSNYECAAYNLTVNGNTVINNYPSYSFNKSGSGNLLFIGSLGTGSNGNINFSGNPNVECRGGCNISAGTGSFNLGTGTITFTTNNQTLRCNGGGGNWTANILISGAITVTNTSAVILGFVPVGTINGDNALSTFNNNNLMYLTNATVPMATGVFNYMNGGSASTLGYLAPGNYTLPYTTYAGLIIQGGGIITLGGNTVVNNNLTITYKLECAAYNLTVNGNTIMNNYPNGVFSKSGAGNLLFVGSFGTSANSVIDWSGGNPNAEFRGGLQLSTAFKTGTGVFTLSTNNQTFDALNNVNPTFDANILISGAITVTYTNGNTGTAFTGTLNGNNSSSIFNCKGVYLYNNATAPMATGKLYCNQAANTFIYGLAGNQDITTPSDPSLPGYYNLTLNGSGAKRLLGNVSVKQVYTLTGPATLNSNGFSLTNP